MTRRSWLVLGALVCAPFGSYAEYAYEEDFSVVDRLGCPYGIEVEKNSHYSHGHYKLIDGRYAVLVMGNRHWLAAPALGDFTLTMDWTIDSLHPHDHDRLGMLVYFHRDRDRGGGRTLEIMRQAEWQRLVISLDGQQLATKEHCSRDELRNARLTLTVAGTEARLEVCGVQCDFRLPRGRGRIAFDAAFTEGEQFYLSRLQLTSPETPAKRELARRKLVLPAVQGFQEPLVYAVTLSEYAEGGQELACELSGGVMSVGPRIETGGSEWVSVIERLESPYLRVESEAGESEQFYLWNGVREFTDRRVRQHRHEPYEWPCRRRYYRTALPPAPKLAAGYEHAICNPWRFAENGPYEALVDAEGRLVYQGEALGSGRVAVRAASSETKRLTTLIPRDLPKYAAALRHAQQEHYFFESEPVSFQLLAHYRTSDWESTEIRLAAWLTDVYGQAVADNEVVMAPARSERIAGGIECRRQEVRLRRNPGVGVWKLQVGCAAGPQPEKVETVIFEVLSDDPNGPCPPLASGLPTFVCMPSEIKYLEQNAFDPWAEFGGVGHYYAIDNRYPAVGNALEIWRLLPLYRRQWWCWNRSRNSNRIDMYDDYTRDIIKHCDLFGGYDNRRHPLARYELGARWHYVGDQLKMLRDYVVERRPNLKLLTPARANRLVAEGGEPSFEELRELFESGWDEFKDYCRPRIAANEKAFTEHLLGIKPTVGFATYGPYAVYVTHYKTAYALDYGGYPIERDPRVRANGSFWMFEEYHHSCDYPLHRPTLFVASYDYHYGYGRRIFPEIYYSSWTRCLDGAVYNAHPLTKTQLAFTHQRRVAYQYVYGTPHFKNGQYGYWTDDGFHARNPEREAMEEFVYAWGKVVAHRPARAPKSPFLALDLELLRRHGEYFDDETNALFFDGRQQADICNTAEEALAYAHDRAVMEGYSTPVVCSAADFDAITPERCDFLVLPPIEAGTPAPVLEAIRRLHARGVNLLATEAVVGLEDLFGVEPDPAGPRPVGHVGNESFSHRLAKARYRSRGARVRLCGSAHAGEAEELPLVFVNETKTGRTAFVNVPPTVLRRATFRNVYHWGQDSLCQAMQRAYRELYAWLSPAPAVKAEGVQQLSAFTKTGELVVVVFDESPIYNDPTVYPKSVKFTVREPGIGRRRLVADAAYSIVSRRDDELTVRVMIDKDTALFFAFSPNEEQE